jgi:hypothetical protein
MAYNKTTEYIETIYNVSTMLKNKANVSNNHRFKAIAHIIGNYAKHITPISLDVETIHKEEYINMTPFFEYVSLNKIEFYDFNKMKPEDIDVSNEADLERYALSHIYYITQK